jgi:hypothetical protein
LYIDEESCFYWALIDSSYFELPLKSEEFALVLTDLDENGHPLLDYDLLYTRYKLKSLLVTDFIMPLLMRDMEFFISFIKEKILIDTFKWSYVGGEKRGKCYELICQHYEPNAAWLTEPVTVKVLIGEFTSIEAELTNSKERYSNSSLLFIDIGKDSLKSTEYLEMAKEVTDKRVYFCRYVTFIRLFMDKFRNYAEIIDTVLKIGIKNIHALDGLLSYTIDNQDELIGNLMKLPTGDGKAYEELVKKILEFCFNDEFNPFRVKEQIGTYNKKRIRDFIIDNRNSRIEFWRDLKSVRGVEKILFDAKNYKNPVEYAEITSTLRYLRNKAFGNFIIIISRFGVKDYEETMEDYAEEGRIILYLSDEDLIAMINLKREGKSPTFLLEEKYYDFLDKK